MTLRKGFQIFLGLFGVIVILIASSHIAFGPSVIPGSVPVNATMDSEDRFYATLFLGYGFALLYCIKSVEQHTELIFALAAVFFVGGIARLISMAQVGLPIPFFILMTGFELVLPVVMVLIQKRITKSV